MYYSLLGQIAFWVLIIWGWAADGFSLATRITFVALWIAGYVLFPYLPNGSAWFAPYVAILDIILIFIVLKDNVRLS
jgi:hypothetical protein